MKISLKLEEAALLVLISVIYFEILEFDAGLFFALFFTPDLGMLGYLANPKIGAFTYNLFHHRLMMIAITLVGYYFEMELLMAVGVIYLAHISFDRMLGYGLKYPDDFKNTHLGSIGRQIKS